MATLWIAELRSLPRGRAGDQLPVAYMPPAAEQAVVFSSASQSAAFGSSTRFIRLYADADCCVSIGESPTATAANTPMAANTPEYFGVESGHKVSVVAR